MATRGFSQYQYNDALADTLSSGLGDFPLDISAGQAVIAGVTWGEVDVTVTSVTDSAGQTYVALTKRKHPTRNLWVQLFYKLNHPGGSNVTLTAQFSAATQYKGICFATYSVSTGAYIAEEWGSTTGTSSVTTQNALVATGDGVVFAGGASWNSWAATPGSGYALVRSFGSVHAYVDRLVSAGSHSPVITDSGNEDIVIAAVLIQDEAATGSEATITPTAGALTAQGRAPTGNAFTAITLRGTLVNEAGSPLANLTNISCLVWYGSGPNGAPDESLSSLTTNGNGSYSFALAMGGLAFNDPVYRVIYQGDPPTRNHAGRRTPSYE